MPVQGVVVAVGGVQLVVHPQGQRHAAEQALQDAERLRAELVGHGDGSANRHGRSEPSARPRMSTSGYIRWIGVAASTNSGFCRSGAARRPG